MGFFLVIVAGLIAWFFISAMMRANRRMAYADALNAKHEIAEGSGVAHRKPNWVQSEDRQQEFVHGTLLLAERNGTPVSYGGTYFTENDKVDELMHFVALLERRGSSFTDQQIAAAEFIMERFQGLPDVIRDHYVDQGADGADDETNLKPNWAGSTRDLHKFVRETYVLVEGRSIPPTFFTDLVANPETFAEMLHTMAMVERKGRSYSDQKNAVVQLVFDRWLVLPADQQTPYRDQQFKDMMADAKRT